MYQKKRNIESTAKEDIVEKQHNKPFYWSLMDGFLCVPF
jgi:hypothetical protein